MTQGQPWPVNALGYDVHFEMAAGLAQTWASLDTSGVETGYLVIFDRELGRSWEEKIYRQSLSHRERPIEVWGL